MYLFFLFVIMFNASCQTTHFISVFNDNIIEGRDDEIGIQFAYGVSGYDITTSVVTTGTIQAINSMAVVGSGTNTTSFAQMQSKSVLPYKSGHESTIFFTAFFPNGSAANSTQWIGLFDAIDGIAIGFNNTTFSILFRQNGIDTTIAQSSFNGDPLNGTGSSGFVLNPSNINVFRLSFGWLGAAPLLFQILDQNGDWITFHTILLSNIIQNPSFSNATLPMTAQINKIGSDTTNLEIRTASWNASHVISQQPSPAQRFFSAESPIVTLSALGIETHLLTIRNKTIFQTKPNKVRVSIEVLTGASVSDIITSVSLIRLRTNATVTGLAFTNVDTANSVTEFSTAGTYTAGTGTIQIITANNTLGSGSRNLLISNQNLVVILNPGETATITGQSLSGGGNIAVTSISWFEIF